MHKAHKKIASVIKKAQEKISKAEITNGSYEVGRVDGYIEILGLLLEVNWPGLFEERDSNG